MRTSERLTIGSNRSLRSLGRAKARPLTKTLGPLRKFFSGWFCTRNAASPVSVCRHMRHQMELGLCRAT
jgi:hypothetical protein